MTTNNQLLNILKFLWNLLKNFISILVVISLILFLFSLIADVLSLNRFGIIKNYFIFLFMEFPLVIPGYFLLWYWAIKNTIRLYKEYIIRYLITGKDERFVGDVAGQYIEKLYLYILKRKKNTVLFILTVTFLKFCIHFFIYTSFKTLKGRDSGRAFNRDLDLVWHLNNVFFEEVQLFIPVILFCLFIAWYFHDKIKAR